LELWNNHCYFQSDAGPIPGWLACTLLDPWASAGTGRRTRTGLGGFAVFKAPNTTARDNLRAARASSLLLFLVGRDSGCDSSVCQLFCLRETLWFDSVAVFTFFFSFCCLFIYQKKLTDSEYLVTQNWSQISSGFGWLGLGCNGDFFYADKGGCIDQ